MSWYGTRCSLSTKVTIAYRSHNVDLNTTGYYADAVLKFRIQFPSNYPEHPPSVHFLTDVFHPLVSQNDGSFNLAPRIRPWRLADFALAIFAYIHELLQTKGTSYLRRTALHQERF